MKKYILAAFLLFGVTGSVCAQEQFAGKGQADRLFERYQYNESLQIYLNVYDQHPDDIKVIERIADCYRLVNKYDESETWYGRAAGKPKARPVDNFYYAEALLRNQKFPEAKAAYAKYYNSTQKEQLDFKLAACDSAAAWMKRTSNYKIEPDARFNTNYSDWGVSYAGKTDLVFASNRVTSSSDDAIDKRTGNGWLKLFDYNKEKKQINELIFEKTGKIDLNKDYHTGPIAFSPGGDTAYVTVTTRVAGGKIKTEKGEIGGRVYTRRLQLMIASKINGKWGNLKQFQYDNVNMFSDGYATLSKDGNTLYFVSDRPGGMGKTDIWYCNKAGSDWGIPYNCGSAVNTPEEESFPFIGPDSKLYFSSKGLPGMGGYDIFSTGGEKAQWGKPVNLKYPINSTSDDFAYSTADGLSGFFSSNRQGGKGDDDIYAFTLSIDNSSSSPMLTSFKNPVKQQDDASTADVSTTDNRSSAKPPAPKMNVPPVAVVTTPAVATVPTVGLVKLTGKVVDDHSGEPIDSVNVTLIQKIGKVTQNMLALDGGFAFDASKAQSYTLEVKKKGYYPATLDIPASSVGTIALSPLRLNMRPLEVGATFIIRNIYYDLNLARIRKDAMVELDKLVDLMRENPTLRIELSSHTDSRGSDYYNMLLSQARAISATNYITRRGIDASRIVAKGYGETRLLNKCGNGVPCSEEDHQMNRRTEIKVLGVVNGLKQRE